MVILKQKLEEMKNQSRVDSQVFAARHAEYEIPPRNLSAPTGRNLKAQGAALGKRNPIPVSPEGAKLRNQYFVVGGKMHRGTNIPRSERKWARRAGISLIEVLVSIFILAVGLLSIAALLPVGQSEVGKAEIDERKAIVAQNAYRSFRTRGMANPANWFHVNFKSNPQDIPFNQPLFLDPTWYSENPINNTRVPQGGGGLPFLRLTLKGQPIGNTPQYALTPAAAEAIFASRDEILFDPSTEIDDPPLLRNDQDTTPGGNPLRRQFAGNYSWMAMLQPLPGQQQLLPSPSMLNNNPTPLAVGKMYPQMPVQLSIIVFYRRPINPTSTGQLQDELTTIPREREVAIRFTGGTNTEATISNSIKNALLLQPGEWGFVYAKVGNQTLGHWVKILTADQIDTSGSPKRNITIAAPDAISFSEGKLILFDGAVHVHTKTIHLEGPSLW